MLPLAQPCTPKHTHTHTTPVAFKPKFHAQEWKTTPTLVSHQQLAKRAWTYCVCVCLCARENSHSLFGKCFLCKEQSKVRQHALFSLLGLTIFRHLVFIVQSLAHYLKCTHTHCQRVFRFNVKRRANAVLLTGNVSYDNAQRLSGNNRSCVCEWKCAVILNTYFGMTCDIILILCAPTKRPNLKKKLDTFRWTAKTIVCGCPLFFCQVYISCCFKHNWNNTNIFLYEQLCECRSLQNNCRFASRKPEFCVYKRNAVYTGWFGGGLRVSVHTAQWSAWWFNVERHQCHKYTCTTRIYTSKCAIKFWAHNCFQVHCEQTKFLKKKMCADATESIQMFGNKKYQSLFPNEMANFPLTVHRENAH